MTDAPVKPKRPSWLPPEDPHEATVAEATSKAPSGNRLGLWRYVACAAVAIAFLVLLFPPVIFDGYGTDSDGPTPWMQAPGRHRQFVYSIGMLPAEKADPASGSRAFFRTRVDWSRLGAELLPPLAVLAGLAALARRRAEGSSIDPR